jgi:hypothetical protein
VFSFQFSILPSDANTRPPSGQAPSCVDVWSWFVEVFWLALGSIMALVFGSQVALARRRLLYIDVLYIYAFLLYIYTLFGSTMYYYSVMMKQQCRSSNENDDSDIIINVYCAAIGYDYYYSVFG